ncbi:hypothetical protein LUZ60_001293 [Juncus effusus]|nr:hypothetical protein LUZ60_001293 [Juncus effusus]
MELFTFTIVLHITIFLIYGLPSSTEELIFNGFKQASNLSLDGSARITKDGILQLTNDTEQLMGHAFFSSPVLMINNLSGSSKVISFSATFILDIITVSDKGGGHGLAFVISASEKLPGAQDGPYLGLVGLETNGKFSNHVFAVEFDTNPGINETNGNHVGIDINSIVSNISELAGYYNNETETPRKVDLDLQSAQGQAIQAWVDYDGNTKILNVTIAPVPMSKPFKPLISNSFDLAPIFKEYMYVGFSSSTGMYASSHYILAWSFRTGGTAQAIDLTQLPKYPKPPKSSSFSKAKVVKFVIISSIATFGFIAILIGLSVYLRKRAKFAETIEDWELDHPHRLRYKDLYRATKGFKESEVLGSGGFGHVYKGILRHTKEHVAIKKISNNTWQGMREFVSEIASLGRMRHRNLVELRGWCKRNDDLLLVYEFMPNGSLDTFLFNCNKNTKRTISWQQRLNILKGVASGLLYLHEEWEQVVVHRDVKASNVLLGSDMNPKLSDFGLARLYEHGSNPHTTHVVGTLGYMAPELSYNGKATTSSDIFAFGVLLLEVACGRRPIEPNAPYNELNIIEWVRDCELKGGILNVVDCKLGNYYNEEEMEMVLKLGLICCQSSPGLRPGIRQVCRYLNGDEQLADDLKLVFVDSDSADSAQKLFPWSYSYGSVSTGSIPSGR